MLEFFVILTLGMMSAFAVIEIYSRTIGRRYANKKLAAYCNELEEYDEFNLNKDLIDGPTTQPTKRIK